MTEPGPMAWPADPEDLWRTCFATLNVGFLWGGIDHQDGHRHGGTAPIFLWLTVGKCSRHTVVFKTSYWFMPKEFPFPKGKHHFPTPSFSGAKIVFAKGTKMQRYHAFTSCRSPKELDVKSKSRLLGIWDLPTSILGLDARPTKI